MITLLVYIHHFLYRQNCIAGEMDTPRSATVFGTWKMGKECLPQSLVPHQLSLPGCKTLPPSLSSSPVRTTGDSQTRPQQPQPQASGRRSRDTSQHRQTTGRPLNLWALPFGQVLLHLLRARQPWSLQAGPQHAGLHSRYLDGHNCPRVPRFCYCLPGYGGCRCRWSL